MTPDSDLPKATEAAVPAHAVAAPRPGLSPADQSEIDSENAKFWNTLCGTALARQLGVVDSSPASLRKFDEWYFAFYPYLVSHIPFDKVKRRRVLEIGLGYGTVAQRLAESGADCTGLDIAQASVDMANYRLGTQELGGAAQLGSILAAPFADNSFDFIVAIGCYHHTGNLQRALDESYRLLRPSGQLIAMVYNAYSYRRLVNSFGPTARYLLWERLGIGRPPISNADERAAYDLDTEGREAPHTDFVSRRHLRRMCRDFSEFRAVLENIDQEKPFQSRSRAVLLDTVWPSIFGLDIYFQARK